MKTRPIQIVVGVCLGFACWSAPVVGAPPENRELAGTIEAKPAPVVSSSQDPQVARSQRMDDEIERLGRELGSEEFAVRRAAFERLWEIGNPIEAKLAELAKHRDRQVAESASLLQLMLRWKISPIDRQSFGTLVALGRNSQIHLILHFCQNGHWEIAESIAREARLSLSGRREESFAFVIAQIAEAAFEQGDSLKALPVIALMLQPIEQAWVVHKTSMITKTASELPQLINNEYRAYREFFLGNTAKAMEIAPTPNVRLKMAMWAANWKAFADPALRTALVGVNRNSLDDRAVSAVLDRVSGLESQSETSMREVVALVEGIKDAPKSNRLALDTEATVRKSRLFIALVSACEIEAALKLMNSSATVEDMQVHWIRSDYSRALSLFGLNDDASNFSQWLPNELKRLQEALQRGDMTVGLENFRYHAELASLLISMGLKKEGEELLEGLLLVGVLPPYDLYCMKAIAGQASHSQARPSLIRMLNKHAERLKSSILAGVLSQIYRDWDDSIMLLYETAPLSMEVGEGVTVTRWDLLETLWRLDREQLEAWLGRSGLDAWFRRAAHRGGRQGEFDDESQVDVDRLTGELSQIALQLGLRELAMQIADEGLGNTSYADKAEVYFQRNLMKTAASAWRIARSHDPGRHDWLIKEMQCLAMAGDEDAVDRLNRSRWLRPLPPYGSSSTSWYLGVAETLQERDEQQLAHEYAEAAWYLSDVGSVDSLYAAHSLADMCHEDKSFRQAAEFRLAGNIGLLSSPIKRRWWSIFLSRSCSMLHDRAMAEIAEQQYEKAWQTLLDAEKVKPYSIELVEDCYPMLKEAGQDEIAERLFTSFSDRMNQHLQKWPSDATSHNNLAWMFARCGRNLDQALSHAMMAVDLSDRSPTFLDTLAEVHFRLGDVDKAYGLACECVKLDPRHKHYQEQVVRFRAAMKEIRERN